MAAVALHALTTAELLDELEDRLRTSKAPGEGSPPERKVHWSFSAAGTGLTPPHILRIRMDLAGLTDATFSTAFGVPPEYVNEWLAGSSAVPPWVIPAIRMYEMLSGPARQKVVRTPVARAGNRSGNTHPFARIEEL